MASDTFVTGTTVRLKFSFLDSTGTLADPTTVKVKYSPPGSSLKTLTYGTDAEVVKDSTGVYYVDVTGDKVGTWRYRGEGTGAVAAVAESSFEITKSTL